MINILVADKLMQSPRLYATFLLWMLSELFEELPEAGDPPKPKLVFFFDEAHLLFDRCAEGADGQDRAGRAADPLEGRRGLFRDAKPDRRTGQGARPIGQPRAARVAGFHPARSEGGRGGGADASGPIRSSTPRSVITELGKGEALVSFLEGNGTPAMVERVMIRPPTARIGPITPEERKAIMNNSPVKGKYDTAIDAESAYEMLQKRVAGTAAPTDGSDGGGGGGGGILGQIGAIVGTIFGTNVSRGRMSTGQIIARSVTRSVTNKVVGGMAADLGKSVGGCTGRFGRPGAGARRARRTAATLDPPICCDVISL